MSSYLSSANIYYCWLFYNLYHCYYLFFNLENHSLFFDLHYTIICYYLALLVPLAVIQSILLNWSIFRLHHNCWPSFEIPKVWTFFDTNHYRWHFWTIITIVGCLLNHINKVDNFDIFIIYLGSLMVKYAGFQLLLCLYI